MYDTVPTVLPGSVSSASAVRVACSPAVAADRCRRLCEPEIKNLRSTRGEKNIRGLDIAMHDALAVRGFQGIGHGARDVSEGQDLQRAASEPLLEGLAFEQLHRDERWIGADIVDRADIGMVER